MFRADLLAVKGSAMCSSFATGKFAMRALAQSLAREFGPKGVHVVHAIIDGVIDIERTKEWKFEHEDAKIKPDSVRARPYSPLSMLTALLDCRVVLAFAYAAPIVFHQ